MTTAFWIWSHLSFVLLSANLLLPLQKRFRGWRAGLICLTMLMLAGLFPVGRTDVSGFVLAHLGTLSTPFLILLLVELLAAWEVITPLSDSARRQSNLVWVVCGLLLYPAALGFFAYDTYSFGYTRSMAWCVLGISGIAVFCRQQLLGICLAASVVAHLLHVHESSNLWDFLIDPWLWLTAVVQTAWCMVRSSKLLVSDQLALMDSTAQYVAIHRPEAD